MPCYAEGCILTGDLAMTPCVVCARGVHHICSNRIHEGELSERFCSLACYTQFSRKKSAATQARSATPSAISIDMSCSEDDRGSEGDDQGDSASSEGDLDDSASDGDNEDIEHVGQGEIKRGSEGKLKLKIPTSVAHSRRIGSRDHVWTFVHDLAVPYRHAGCEYRSICLLCVDKACRASPKSKSSWLKGLCNVIHASNAKLHIRRIHRNHVYAKELIEESTARAANKMKGKRNRADSEAGAAPATTSLVTTATESIPNSNEPSEPAQYPAPSKRQSVRCPRSNGKLDQFLQASHQSTVNTAVSKWLMDDGIPYFVVSTPAFRNMMRAVSAKPSTTVLARDTYNDAVNGRFKNFCDTVANLLAYQHDRVHGLRYLTLIHDAWTCNKSTGIIGASVAFIDHQWSFRHIAVVAACKNDGHSSGSVSELIENQFKLHYGLDIRAFARWTMSDTTSSARSVATYFEETEQEDCKMHVLNLCIAYGIGLKENVKKVKAQDGTVTKEIVTLGGALPQGADAIRKLRALNNYFSTPKRMNKLTTIQQVHGLPKVKPLVDVDVRVASTCRLMRRSIKNYTAMKMCFMDESSPNVFTALTDTDWTLIIEMEAITLYLAELALSEVQSQDLVASYMLVYRTFAEAHLKSMSYQCLKLTGQRSTDKRHQRDERENILAEKFSEPGRICIARCKAQIASRFPPLSSAEAVVLILDPRTKNCAGDVIDNMGNATVHRERLMKEASEVIISEYVKLEQRRHARQSMSEASEKPRTPPRAAIPANTTLPGSILMIGAPVPSKTRRGFRQTRIVEEASAELRRWMCHQEDWAEVAIAQGLGTDHATTTAELSFRRDKEMCWNIVALSKIDLLRWFRDVGQEKFPVLSLIARLWLGKVSSTAFQERVFSTAGIVMSKKRSQTDNDRAEKLLLMRVNRTQIDC